jgi:hypothetical protein
VPATASPGAAYRADRRASVIYGAARALGILCLAAVLGPAAGIGWGRWLWAVLAPTAGAGLLFALLHGTVSLVMLSEPVLPAQWRERVRFGRLPADAVDRGILRGAGAAYQFGDAGLQERLGIPPPKAH